MSNGPAYRRGSVFGALLLITIGGLFLYANFQPDFSPWPLVATYWPVIIIFWGLGKLFDYLMLRGTPEAVAATRLTGGDILGLIFLLLLGSAFSQFYQRGLWRGGPISIGEEELGCLFGSEFNFTDDLEFAAAPRGTFSLNNVSGGLSVHPAADNTIRVHATKRVCAASESEARRLAERFLPVLEAVGDGYEFHWDTPAGATGLLRTDLTVELPRGLAVQARARRGDVELRGVEGEVGVELERGHAVLSDVAGNVRAEIRRGSVDVSDVRGNVIVTGRGGEISFTRIGGAATLEGEYYGPIKFAAIAGPARFVSRRTTFDAARIEGEMLVDSGELVLRGVPGDVSLLTRNKEIEVEGITGALRIANRNGRVVVRAATPPARPIEVENERGSIELVLPSGSGFQISASARRGDITSEFPGLEAQRRSERDRDDVLSGSVGDARVTIRLSTSYGTIAIRRTG